MTLDDYEKWVRPKSTCTEEDTDRHISSLRTLEEFCSRRGYSVIYQHRAESRIEPLGTESGLIVIETSKNPLVSLSVLLHEMGHMLISSTNTESRYVHGYGSKNKRTKRYRMDVLDEEFQAWHQGWNLGVSLFFLNADDRGTFDRVKYAAINSYVKWSAE